MRFLYFALVPLLILLLLVSTTEAARENEVWVDRAGSYIESVFSSGRDILVKGANKYINFNTTVGSSGYGLRDNAGTIEFKHNGDDWQVMGTGGAGGGASSTIIQIGDVTVNSGVPTIDFGRGLTVSESPTDEFNVSVSTTSASLEEFGANSTDGSDDYAAIQAAMDWSNTYNGRVTCSPGTYKLSAPLDIPASADFLYLDFATDCRFERTFSSTGIDGMITNADTAGAADGSTRPKNITIKGGDWGSAYTPTATGTASAVTYTGNTFSFIADNLLLDGVHMNGLGSSGRFFLGGGENFRILKPVWKHAEVDSGTGGARILAGSGLVADGEIISGDDTLAAVPGENGNFGDLSLGHVVFRDMRGTSTAARFFAVGLTNQTAGSQATFTASIGRVDCVRCSGAGADYGAIVTAVDTTGQIGEVNIIDSEFTDVSPTNGSLLYGILVDGGTGLARNGNMGIGAVRLVRTRLHNTHGTAFQQIGEVGTIELDSFTADPPREAGAAAIIARQAERMIARNVDVSVYAGENGYQIGTNTTGEEVKHLHVDGGVVRDVYHSGASTVRYGFNLVKTGSALFTNRPRVEVATSSIYVRYLGLSANTYNTNLISADMREITAAVPVQDLAAGTRFGRDILTATSTYRDASVLTATEGGTGTSTYSTGDFLYASAANTLSRLPIGTNGQIMMVQGTTPMWVSTSSLGISGGTASTTEVWDMFLIGGQSNAVAGAGDIASSTYAYPGTAKTYYNGTIYDVTNDMTPGNGGPWPAFAARYYQLTGRKIAFVHTAVGGTGLNATSSGGVPTESWGPEGTLLASSTDYANDAIADYAAQGITTRFAGILWSQGENDAVYINSLDQTAAHYRASLESVISRYRTAFGTSTPFYIFRTGTHVLSSDIGYRQVRQEQENVAASDPNTYIVFRDALDYVRRGMMYDNVHYNQFGYNDMGRIGAEGVLVGESEPHWYSISNALIYNPYASSSGPVYIGAFGVATSTWASTTFAVHLGDTRLFGALGDSTGATGTLGMVLQSSGTSTRWVATSSLGISGSGGLTSADIDTSAELATILTDETGTAGSAVFSVSPTLTGTTTMQTVGFGFATSSVNSGAAAATTTNLVIYDPTNSNAWSLVNPWGLIRWQTGDAGFPSKSHWGMGPVMNTTNGNNSNFAIYSDVNNSGLLERMRISLDGDVSIGTTTSPARLAIKASSGTAFGVYSNTDSPLFTVLNSGGITLPGNTAFQGGLLDVTASDGTLGMVLQSTGTSTLWVATSSLGFVSGAGLTSLNGQTGSSQTFASSSSGADFSITSSGNVHTWTLPSATSTARGLLTANDWLIFNNKLGTTSIDTSAKLAAILTDETGTGSFVLSAAPTLTGTTTVGGLTINTISGFLKGVAGAVVSALVDLTTDVTGVLPIANGGTGTTTPKVWSATIASTSAAFISGGLFPVPDQGSAYTITRIHCQVIGGTSKVIAIEDASANSSEDITCTTSDSFDDGSITNASYIAWEDQYIDFGATSGAVDYVKITVFGN